jgi:hypothetical protein
MTLTLPTLPVRLDDVPGLSPAALLELANTLPTHDLQRLWDAYGIDDEADCDCPDVCACVLPATPPAARAWYLPYDVLVRVLERLKPRDYADPEEDPDCAMTLPGPGRAESYSRRRPEDLPENGLLGYAIFSTRDVQSRQLDEKVCRAVSRGRNGAAKAGAAVGDGGQALRLRLFGPEEAA